MKEIYLLQHVHEIDDDREDVKIIGVYSSKKNAENVIDKYKKLPGFSDFQNMFFIDKYIIDKNNWEEGFISE